MSNNKAFSLVETLIYATILAVASVLVVGALLRIGPVYVKAQNLRKVNAAGSFAMDRLVREMRKGTNFQYSNGELTFDSQGTFEDFVRKDGAVSYYNFEEASGKLLDQIGQNHGTKDAFSDFNDSQRGSAVVAQVGHGYNFVQPTAPFTTQQFNLPVAAFDAHTTGAIEAIIKATITGDYAPIFSYSKDGAVDSNIVFGVRNGRLFVLERLGPSNYYKCLQTNDVFGEEFQQVALVQTIDSFDLYVNGIKRSTDVMGQCQPGHDSEWFNYFASQPFNAWGPGQYAIAGGRVSLTGKYMGIIDELAVYPTALSGVQLASHYKSAFGVQDDSGDTLIQRKINTSLDTATNKYSLNYSPSGSSVPLTSPNDVNVTNFSANVIKLQSSDPSGIGAEITFSVTAGTGPSAVTRTFKTAAVGRKTN